MRMNNTQRKHLDEWNARLRLYLSQNTLLSTSELRRRANVHKADMSKFMSGRKNFGVKILTRIEDALSVIGYKSLDPNKKKLQKVLEERKRHKNIFLMNHD